MKCEVDICMIVQETLVDLVIFFVVIDRWKISQYQREGKICLSMPVYISQQVENMAWWVLTGK